jgi:hypothetical protein
MPWRGPNEPGEYPTLGYDIGEWIEGHIVIPDGYRKGQPFLLTDEMWRFLLRFYRLDPGTGRNVRTAMPHTPEWTEVMGELWYYGAQLRRSQKWGKDPFGAAIIWAEALGPARFDGWDAAGEPVGAPYPTPYIPCLGTSEEQTDNTYRPVMDMARGGPLADLPGLDVGETRCKLPGGGEIEPVAASARARLGQRMTFATLTETHLWTLQGGYRRLAGAVKRNIAGMDGRWLELTNAWDPTEGSEAQVTAEVGNPRVYVDTVEPRRVDDLADDEALLRELARQYGDSAQSRGGWVNLDRIADEVRSPAHLEADRRRFFLNEIVVGESVLVDPEAWDLQARPDDTLRPGDLIALGFDGSKYRDATALVASRMADGHLVTIRIWERPANAARDWRVPSAEVDRVVGDVFGAYRVTYLYADPYRWQDYLDAWSARWPKQIVEFPTNVEQRMDRAIERFLTRFGGREITHDGNDMLTRHAKNTVVVKGAVLAGEARGQAIEDGLNVSPQPPATAPAGDAGDGAGSLWRPTSRLRL